MKLFENKAIISFGDSVMKGIVTSDNIEGNSGTSTGYTISEDNFANLCGQRLGARITNFGRFGNTVGRGMKDIARHYSKLQDAEYAFLEFGGNDSNYDWNAIADNPDGEYSPATAPSDFRSIYKEMINVIKSAGCTPVILSLPPIDPAKFFRNVCRSFTRESLQNVLQWLGGNVAPISNWHEMYNLELYRIAAEENIRIIDISSCFLSKRNYSDYLCNDGMHPNVMGHRIISDTIVSY